MRRMILCIILIAVCFFSLYGCEDENVIEPEQGGAYMQNQFNESENNQIDMAEVKRLSSEIEDVANELSNQVFFTESLEEVVETINDE